MRLLLLTAAAALVAAPAATAHVTLNPDTAPANGFARFDVRVPTEEDNPTVGVTVQLPEGLTFVSFQPKPGWNRTEQKSGDRVTSVTWTGGSIAPGEFDEFGLSARMPNKPGTALVFPALQRYSSGKVVRWIQAPDGENPAPRVTVEAAEPEEAATTTSEDEQEEDDDGEDRANLALGLGAAGLIAGLAALGMGFRRRRQ